MSMLSAPPKQEFKLLTPDLYEAVIVKLEEIENAFYEPATDSPNKATQFKWTLKVREPGSEGVTLTIFSGSALGRHPKNKLVAMLRTLDLKFDIEAGYESDEALIAAVLGQCCRVMVSNTEPKVVDGEERIYNKVDALLASKSPATGDELEAFMAAAALGAEIAF